MPDPALHLAGVTKRYADHIAVDGLGLSVPAGTIYGLLGPNGAGKSTTIRMVMGIVGRDDGEIRVLGRDPAVDRSVLDRVGYLPEERGLYKKMRVLDAIVFFARLKGMGAAAARAGAEGWLERLDLGEWKARRVEQLSKGMQQKVQFVATVLHDPDLWVLDEPFSGLDPVNQDVLREAVLDARRRGRTVVLSTHVMEHAEQLCDRVCIVARGRKLLEGEVRAVRREAAGRRYSVEFDPRSEAVERAMRPGAAFARVAARGERYEVELAEGADPRRVLADLATLDAPLVRWARVEPTLHEVFVSLVAGRGGGASPGGEVAGGGDPGAERVAG
ncbi:ATP-binding cassette domain-containing protein [Myxococcota bacterium]|nr:ATP-binding cassette domain-containing protein [Myxococcota bacterium]